MKIAFQKTRDVKTPQRSTRGSAGFDFFIPKDVEWESKLLRCGDSLLISSGIKVELPEDYCLLAVNKSGLGSRGLSVGACLIDSDYRGEIHLNVFNNGVSEVRVQREEKLVQFLLLPVVRAEFIETNILTTTERSANGFGSTGKF